MGLGAEGEREKREKGEGESVFYPPLTSSPTLSWEKQIGWEERDHGEALACWVGFILFDRRCHSMI